MEKLWPPCRAWQRAWVRRPASGPCLASAKDLRNISVTFWVRCPFTATRNFQISLNNFAQLSTSSTLIKELHSSRKAHCIFIQLRLEAEEHVYLQEFPSHWNGPTAYDIYWTSYDHPISWVQFPLCPPSSNEASAKSSSSAPPEVTRTPFWSSKSSIWYKASVT